MGPLEELLAALGAEEPDARAAARMQLVARGHDAVGRLIGVLESGPLEARREAALALGELRAAEAVPALLRALAAEPYEVASWAARALGSIGDRRAVGPLVEKVGDEEMRNAAAMALGVLRDPAAVEPLGRALETLLERYDYGAYLGRYWVASALLALGDRGKTTIEALKEVVDRDFGPESQQTWGSLRDAAIDLLVEALGRDADVFLRPFLKRERETLQVRFRIARHYWLQGEQTDELRAILERMSRHPLYPQLSGEARDLLAPGN